MDKPKIVQRIDQIEQFDDVFVSSPNQSHGVAETDPAELIRKLGLESSPAQADLKKLKDAGWGFSVKEKSTKNGDFELIRDSDGHLKLAGRSLTVQLQPNLDRSQVDSLLANLSLTIIREFGFSKNTFLVAVKDEKVLGIVRSLNELEDVVYAEPNLIEVISGRR